ncbi:hypothetical protein PR048_030282 [Dryococelus australis]|uniref:Uncharacterized protein n=1 Tax=Dryococelus australis TaxID=614101 RepID=A0ABQ9G9B4_9NEOP|nr:hypothetical protein PR048_030282 [Dryococelus australis]
MAVAEILAEKQEKGHIVIGRWFMSMGSLLQKHYNNKCLIVSHHTETLVSAPQVTSGNATTLLQLLSTIQENISALRFMEISVESWDPLLLHLVEVFGRIYFIPYKSTADGRCPECWPEAKAFAKNNCFVGPQTWTLTCFSVVPRKCYRANVGIRDASSKSQMCRALSNSGSQANFITSECLQQYSLPRCKLVHAHLGCRTPKSRALPHATISDMLPNTDLSSRHRKQLANLHLADSQFGTPSSIDFLIEAELFPQLLTSSQIDSDPGSAVALDSPFGCLDMGKGDSKMQPEKSASVTCHHLGTEEVPYVVSKTPDEQECEEILQHPHRQREDDVTRTEAEEFMIDYTAARHMEKLPESDKNGETTYYIPHHCVLKPLSTTTKLRVVSDALGQTTSGLSLNNILLPGQTLQADICNLIPILWHFEQSNPVEEYRLQTVTYNSVCVAPFLAICALHQLAEGEGSYFPLAVVDTLGPWCRQLSYKVQPPKNCVTKRGILSDLAKIFDPLRRMAPLVLWAKYDTYPGSVVKLHGFSDNFEIGYAAVVVSACCVSPGLCYDPPDGKIEGCTNKNGYTYNSKAWTVQELQAALMFWIKKTQASESGAEISTMEKGESPVSLPRIKPFIDTEGKLRVGGSLQASSLPFDQKHPKLLPKGCHLNELIIDQLYNALLHPGPQHLLSVLQQEFWVVNCLEVNYPPKLILQPFYALWSIVVEAQTCLVTAGKLSMERCRNEGVRETGDRRENPPTNGIVWHDSHLRKSDKDSDGPVVDIRAGAKEARKIGIGVLSISAEKLNGYIEVSVGVTAEVVDCTAVDTISSGVSEDIGDAEAGRDDPS